MSSLASVQDEACKPGDAAASEGLADNIKTECVTGLFEQVPASWLHQLSADLPPASKKAFLAVSKATARSVVESAVRVTLQLRNRPRWTGGSTQTRAEIISELLSMCREFTVDLDSTAWGVFPVKLADRVQSCTFSCIEGVVGPANHWDTLTNLRNLTLEGGVLYERDISGLCDAVEAGQLKKLRSLRLHILGKRPHLQRILQALGPLLEDVTTRDENLVLQLHKLTALKSFTLTRSDLLTTGMFQRSFEHPTLTHVTFHHLSTWVSQRRRSCNWQHVTVHDSDLVELGRLPLSGVQVVRVGHGMFMDLGPHATMFPLTVGQHLHKLECQPGITFKLSLIVQIELLVPLLERLQGMRELVLVGGVLNADTTPILWQALPTSVRTIKFHEVKLVDGVRLWQNMPQHVVEVVFYLCDRDDLDECALVDSTPPHIQTLVFVLGEGSSPDTVLAPGPRAPPHLKVILRG